MQVTLRELTRLEKTQGQLPGKESSFARALSTRQISCSLPEHSLLLLLGGSKSGKSRWGEEWAQKAHLDTGFPLFYIATLYPGSDGENQDRIKRHRRQREGKDFQTLEIPRHLSQATPFLPEQSIVLVDCLGNLVANELFTDSPEAEEKFDLSRELGLTSQQPVESRVRVEETYHQRGLTLEKSITDDLLSLSRKVYLTVLVSNQVFADAETFDLSTRVWINTVGKIHQKLAGDPQTLAVQVLAGIPLRLPSTH